MVKIRKFCQKGNLPKIETVFLLTFGFLTQISNFDQKSVPLKLIPKLSFRISELNVQKSEHFRVEIEKGAIIITSEQTLI